MSEREFTPMIAFDFDGVVARYDGFRDHNHVGDPNEPVVETIRELKEAGCIIIVHSTRGSELLRDYCTKHDIPADYINENPVIEGKNPGKPYASIYVDDRALNYHGQSADELLTEIKQFKVYRKTDAESRSRQFWKRMGHNDWS